MRLLVVLLLCAIVIVSFCDDLQNSEKIHRREKRQYYGGYDYGCCSGDDFWYVGRIIGMIVGIIVLLFCCCLPCICIVGIWFAGWFGLRRRDAAKKTQQEQATNSTQQPIVVASPILPTQQQQIPASYDTPGNANYIIPPTARSRYPVVVESSPNDVSRVAMPDGQVVYSAEDRYYTSSTAPAPTHRPEVYTTTTNRY